MKKSETYSGRLWRLLYPILAYMGIIYLVQFLGLILFVAFAVLSIKQSGGALEYYSLMDEAMRIYGIYGVELTSLASLLAIPAELYFLSQDKKEREGVYPSYERVGVGYFLLMPFLGAAACLAINNMMNIAGLFRIYQDNMQEVSSALYHGKLLVELLGIAVVTPILEEILFRGILQQRIRDNTSAGAAIFASAILFGGYHGNALQMIYAALLGLIIAYVFEKYKSLWAAIGVHMGANLISVLGSETGLMDGLYENDWMLIGLTALWCVIIFFCIYVVHYRVNPQPVGTSEEVPSEEPEQ